MSAQFKIGDKVIVNEDFFQRHMKTMKFLEWKDWVGVPMTIYKVLDYSYLNHNKKKRIRINYLVDENDYKWHELWFIPYDGFLDSNDFTL